ncbi:MAG TPA: SemiSWEET transporter [Candidatus Acidoferrum sp.]|nr:SemiSWEET transporter [Candidatus Acidoferrum sp.]
MSYLILGLIAGTLTTIAYLPQAIKVVRTKKTRDLSLPWLAILATGVAFWLVYGLLVSSLPIILANFFSLALILCILVYKIRY